jgi:hypothetical protein
MHAAEDDYLTCGVGSLLGQAEGITGKIGDLLDFVTLVVVSQQQCVAFPGQAADFLLEFFRPPPRVLRA